MRLAPSIGAYSAEGLLHLCGMAGAGLSPQSDGDSSSACNCYGAAHHPRWFQPNYSEPLSTPEIAVTLSRPLCKRPTAGALVTVPKSTQNGWSLPSTAVADALPEQGYDLTELRLSTLQHRLFDLVAEVDPQLLATSGDNIPCVQQTTRGNFRGSQV
jgi:hypothetical protein